jgi:hypothetical protein
MNAGIWPGRNPQIHPIVEIRQRIVQDHSGTFGDQVGTEIPIQGENLSLGDTSRTGEWHLEHIPFFAYLGIRAWLKRGRLEKPISSTDRKKIARYFIVIIPFIPYLSWVKRSPLRLDQA